MRFFRNGHPVDPNQPEEDPLHESQRRAALRFASAKMQVWALRPGFFFQDIEHLENENVVRARAGILNMVAVTMLLLIAVSLSQQEAGITPWKDLKNALTPVAVVVLADFTLGSVLGLCACPTGILGIILSFHIMKQKPFWVPSRPKRFAWTLGIGLVSTCLLINLLLDSYKVKKALLLCFVSSCAVLTFLESAFGLCVGCRMFGAYYRWRSARQTRRQEPSASATKVDITP